MKKFSERLIDPKSPERRPRKAAYALPTLFTAANVFLGFLSIMKSVEGAIWASKFDYAERANVHFELAALLIGIAFVCDGLDGRIARMTNTTSEFGKEMDSLADVITFCLAPAVLAFTWGVLFLDGGTGPFVRDHFFRAGAFISFLFLICGAMRLARFNIQTNPIPKNPGRPDRKYFVGLPTPPAAGMLAAVVYAVDGSPITSWYFAVVWLALVLCEGLLMISMWRYRSFKDLNMLQPRSPLSLILVGSLIFMIWNYSKPVLLGLATAYLASGIIVRIGGIIKRLLSRPPRPENPREGASVA